MGIVTFLKNIRHLHSVNIKQMNKRLQAMNLDEIYAVMNAMLDNVVYELPEHLGAIAKPKIKNFEDTIDTLVSTEASFCRFGDGELSLIANQGIHFQPANSELARRLKSIILSQKESLFIGVNYQYYYGSDLNNFSDYGKFVYRSFIHPFRAQLDVLLDMDWQYYSAGVTSAYMIYKRYDFEAYFDKIKKIWAGKDIAIICGERVFKDIDYNIFDCANSVEYYHEPSRDAFSAYEKILSRALEIPPSKLVVCILGPTAKVLTYDLTMEGYRALDMGHIAKDYDAYRKKMPRTKQTIGQFFQAD